MTTMSAVTVSVLGPPKLIALEHQVPVRGGKSEALLVQLALAHSTPVSRALLLEQLWPVDDEAFSGQALNSLTSELNKLSRKHVNQINVIRCEQQYYQFNTDAGVGTDIDYFDGWQQKGLRLLKQGDFEQGLDYCNRALTLYRDDLCGDSNIYTLIERERLRTAVMPWTQKKGGRFPVG